MNSKFPKVITLTYTAAFLGYLISGPVTQYTSISLLAALLKITMPVWRDDSPRDAIEISPT